jgi:hypothetical protein
MDKMIAYCGLICSECEAFIATRDDDNAKRKEIAEKWTQQFGHPMKPEDVNCGGCISDSSPKIGYCNICEIRKCGQERGVVNCAYCNDYGCKKLTDFWGMAPNCKATLDEIRKGL